MTTLYIRFARDLTDYAEGAALAYHGPLFHRWLPNGQADSIALQTGHPDYELRVWFERCGFTQGEFVEFAFDRNEVEPAIMERQGILDAGALRGLLTLQGLPDATLLAMQGQQRGDDAYRSFAKSLIQDILYPPLDCFMTALRVNFGQTWIRSLEPWDSRSLTLGAYCGALNMKWAIEPSGPWTKFIPDEPIHMLGTVVTMDGEGYLEYLTRDDWLSIPRLLDQVSPPSTSAVMMRGSHELLAHGRIRYALVEGCSALELAIEDYVRSHQGGSQVLHDLVKSFFNLSLGSRMATLSASIGRLPRTTIEAAASAIHERNGLVHEGKEPSADAPNHLRQLLRVISSLLPGPLYRFPEPHHQNTLAEPSKWDEIYARQNTP